MSETTFNTTQGLGAASLAFPASIMVDASGRQVDARQELIRFPHIPSRFRALPGKSQYRLANGHLMRTDTTHELPAADTWQTTPASEKSPKSPLTGGSLPIEVPAPHLRLLPQHDETPLHEPADINLTAAASHAATRIEVGEPISKAQVSQIAEYLRRKRDEIEAENSELAINSWQQQQWLLEQKEQLRKNATAILRTQSLLEELRCKLIELGYCLEEESSKEGPTLSHFSKLCETFFALHEESRSLG